LADHRLPFEVSFAQKINVINGAHRGRMVRPSSSSRESLKGAYSYLR
jgi:hypothetical protein